MNFLIYIINKNQILNICSKRTLSLSCNESKNSSLTQLIIKKKSN
jgi:hypothetical protein